MAGEHRSAEHLEYVLRLADSALVLGQRLAEWCGHGPVLEELRRAEGALSDATRFRLAFEAFRRTAQYDAAIAAYLREPGATGRPAAAAATGFPERLPVDGLLDRTLRYGETARADARAAEAGRLGVR